MIEPVVKKARIKIRHVMLLLSFLLVVLVPVSVSTWYLTEKAQAQFRSTVAFTVRTEDVSSAIDLLGGLSALGSNGSQDTDILYEYILSRSLIEKIHRFLNLKSLYAKNYKNDPWYSLNPNGTIEDIVKYWNRMISVVYDHKAGMIEITVKAFSSVDAKLLAETILLEGSKKINQLSEISRQDTVKYAKQELHSSMERLRNSRLALAKFRSENKLIDPQTELGVQNTLLSALLQDLSSSIVEKDMLDNVVKQDDPRKVQLQRKIIILKDRVSQERKKFTSNGYENSSYSDVMLKFESLSIDLEYAQQAYLAAMASYDSAVIEGQRQSRYLATYIDPTFAERSEYPKIWIILSVLCLITTFVWITMVLIFYALRDKR